MILLTEKYYNNVKINLLDHKQVIKLVEDNLIPLDIADKMYRSFRSAIESYWFEYPEKRVIPSKDSPLVKEYNDWISYVKSLSEN